MASIRRGRRAAIGFLHDFKEFALKGNVVDLAVGVIIGAAFGNIVSSLVEDVVMPLLNPVLSIAGTDWRDAVIGPGIKIGSFLSAVIDFFVIALALYVGIRAIARMRREQEPEAPDPMIESQEKLTSAVERLTAVIDSKAVH